MANKKTQNLSAQILPLVLSESGAEIISKTLNTPEEMARRRETRQFLNNTILRQVHDTVCSIPWPTSKPCPYVKEVEGQVPKPCPSQHSGILSNAFVEVQRQENIVTINWKMKEWVEDPAQFSVSGSAWEIDLIPDPDKARTGGLIATGTGNGSVRLELEEGISYQFVFQFLNLTTCNKEDVEPSLDVVYFQVAIPLSDERKALLRKAVTLNFQPEEAIRHEVNSFIGKRAALDEALKDGIAQIKAKKLRPKDEKEKIEDLTLKVQALMKKHNA